MERIDALKQLAAKVEAGDKNYHPAKDFHFIYGGPKASFTWEGSTAGALDCDKAYHGSLDAAKALMEAVLPGWDVQIGTYDDETFEASVAPALEAKSYDRISHCMARAWLLAILRALIAMEEAK
jgi:hypothetical protein